MLPLVAFLLPVILILAGMVVNLAWVDLTRTKLRIASDAATRAAGATLALTGDQARAQQAARDASQRNPVNGNATQLANGDIVFGVAKRSSLNQRYLFTAGGSKVNAVRVNLRRDAGSRSGLMNMVFPTFGGVKTFGPSQQAASSQVELDVVLVLDRSGSMAYGDAEDSYAMASAGQPPASAPPGWTWGAPAPPGSRWRELVVAVNVFTAALNKSPQIENLCLVTYADDAKRESNLNSNYSPVAAALGVYTNSFNAGRTNIGGGIIDGVNALNDATYSRPWAVKAVIVLTDGIHNIGTDPEGPAGLASSQGMTVYTVTFANEADQSRMEKVASLGGGKHFHASNGTELQQVFREIATSLPTLLVQ